MTGTRVARHGKRSTYVGGCRCNPCREAATKYARAWRTRNRGRLRAADPRHGTPGGYSNWGCRCRDCRRAWRDASREIHNLHECPSCGRWHGEMR